MWLAASQLNLIGHTSGNSMRARLHSNGPRWRLHVAVRGLNLMQRCGVISGTLLFRVKANNDFFSEQFCFRRNLLSFNSSLCVTINEKR